MTQTLALCLTRLGVDVTLLPAGCKVPDPRHFQDITSAQPCARVVALDGSIVAIRVPAGEGGVVALAHALAELGEPLWLGALDWSGEELAIRAVLPRRLAAVGGGE